MSFYQHKKGLSVENKRIKCCIKSKETRFFAKKQKVEKRSKDKSEGAIECHPR